MDMICLCKYDLPILLSIDKRDNTECPNHYID